MDPQSPPAITPAFMMDSLRMPPSQQACSKPGLGNRRAQTMDPGGLPLKRIKRTAPVEPRMPFPAAVQIRARPSTGISGSSAPQGRRQSWCPAAPRASPMLSGVGVSGAPHGYLLLARWVCCFSGYDGEGFSVLDPNTLEQIYDDGGSGGCVTWSASFPSSLVRPAASAAFTGAQMLVDFSKKESGEWRAMAFRQSEFSQDHHVCIASDCSMLVGARQKGGGHAHAFHAPLAGGNEGFVLPKLPVLRRDYWMQWAPMPAAWPQLYAYVHHTKGGRHQSPPEPGSLAVSLVASRKPVVLGTWTAHGLASLLKARKLRGDETGEPHSVKWAPNGRHLAVLCEHCTLVMTFGPPG